MWGEGDAGRQNVGRHVVNEPENMTTSRPSVCAMQGFGGRVNWKKENSDCKVQS